MDDHPEVWVIGKCFRELTKLHELNLRDGEAEELDTVKHAVELDNLSTCISQFSPDGLKAVCINAGLGQHEKKLNEAVLTEEEMLSSELEFRVLLHGLGDSCHQSGQVLTSLNPLIEG